MSETAIDSLRDAIKTAARTGPFALDAAFLQTGLGDGSVTVPAGYDTSVQAAFQVAGASAFTVAVSPDNVGPVSTNAFTVTKASIPFLGSTLNAEATLVFAVAVGPDDTQTLVIQIESSPANWSWTNSFAFMGGFPFNQLKVANARFIFSTADGTYPWTNGAGPSVAGGAKQNFFSRIPLPDIVRPVLVLFDGLTPPTGNLDLSGVLDLSAYNGSTVLYPSGTLNAALSDGSFSLLYLKVSNPSVRLTIPPPADSDDEEGNDQAPSLSVASGISIDGIADGQSPYTLEVAISPPVSRPAIAAAANGPAYRIGLTATGDGPQLTPASIIALAGSTGSYFSATPPVLQQFLAFVGLQGLALAGNLGAPPTLTSLSVAIGSAKGTSWKPIPDPTGKLDFTITSFYLVWSIQNPFESASRQQSFLFGTQFTLAPEIFKGANGQGDGIFTVEFNSGLQFYAAFDGTASLSDFLSTLTDGAVSLPSTIQASLSNIRLNLDYNAQSFSFVSGFDVSLAFLEVGGKPIIAISDGQVGVAAKTPTQDGTSPSLAMLPVRTSPNGTSKTVWQSQISGLMAVGPLTANVKVGYDGFQTPARWNLNASLAQPITVQDLIEQFFNPTGSYQFPDFLPGTLTIKTFAIDAVIPSGKGDLATSYKIDTSFSWLIKLDDQSVGIDPARVGLAYDGAKPAGRQFSGLAEGTWVYDAINLQLLMGYKFVPTEQGTNNILYVEWEGFRAEYESGKEQITFSLKGWSLGTLIQALVRTLGDPYFTLPSPWNLLDQVSLDGLGVAVSLKSGVQNRLSASYTLSSPINLGFVTIKALVFQRDTTGKVTLAIDGSISPVLLDSVPPAEKQKLTNLMSPTTGQDVRDMPSIPGRGEEYFKLFLLVLGQRIGITGHADFKDTKDVICALQNVPNTTGKTNPVDPNANQGSPAKGLPYYNQSNNWLIAAHLGLLKVGNAWTVDAMLVFNDPDLYGLRLALAGPKVGGLANLSVDVLYKKISDDIGVFQIEFTFPDAIRNLNFGTVSITLPEIGIKVYTNGDFFIDIGFPYNLDFRRSFSIAAIVYGVPVLGAGGFYFGKLSNATATQVPKTTKGTFDPVIVFGLGLQLGLGYNFKKGPLSAGFAVTFFGIVEGVLAPWHPYDSSSRSTALALAGGALQSDFYFKLKGTIGVIGLLYGKIDFAIIQASVNVKFTLAAQITYESYRAIPLVVLASVDVSVKVKIDLGLFSISISLSFSTTVSATFVLGSDEPQRAPWYESPALAAVAAHRAALLSAGPEAVRSRARRLTPRPKRVAPCAAANPTLTLLAAPQFTVLAPEGATKYQQQEGAFVFLLAMDAPDATKHNGQAGATSFDQLCASFFPWVIDALGKSEGDVVDLRAVAATNVTRADLEAYIDRLADLDAPAFTIGDLLGFLASSFELNITTPEQARASGLVASMQAGSVLFPVFDGLSLSVPKATGSGSTDITFETYASATSAYRKTVADIFAQVEAVINQQNEAVTRLLAAGDDAESMSSLIFVDTFALIGRQLLQAALDSLDSYAYRLKATDSIEEIISWANAAGNLLTPDDVAVPNQDHQLSAGIPLTIRGLTYTIQSKDTLATIAAHYTDPNTSAPRWLVKPGQIIEANGPARVLQPDVTVIVQGKDGPVKYPIRPGDSFEQIAETVGITLAQLADQESLYGVAGLLTPGRPLAVPEFSYTTAGRASASEPSSDTLGSITALFATTVSRLAAANIDVHGLFSPAAEGGIITLAALAALSVGDLWKSVQATDQVAQTAGMVSRFLLFGLRLPSEAGLGLSAEFLYPTTQHGYGMYQLTGQQFPIPGKLEGDSSYGITLSRAAAVHRVDLSFIKLNETDSTSVPVDLTEAYGRVSFIRDWVSTGAFTPVPSFEMLPLASRAPKAFAVNTYSLWSTSDVAALERLTNRANAVATSSWAAQKQPILWNLPPSLASLLEARQASLTPLFKDLTGMLPLLPQFQPQVGSTSPSSHVTSYADIEHWAWATRVDFQVKRLPRIAALSPDGTGSGSTPAGPASAASLPNVYELVGPSSEDALRLEQVLSVMDALGEDLISGLFLLYEQPGSTMPTLLTLGDQEFLSFITQTNLSTETNPARSLRLALAAPNGAPPRGIANAPGEFVKLLWELSVVRSGGYYLFYQIVDGGDGLPASIFDTSGTATISMVVTYAAGGHASIGQRALNFVNAFVTTDSIDTATDTVQVLSRDASGKSAPLSGSAAETLGSLAAIYGIGPGRIAEANATIPLTHNSVIPANGIVRQLQQADLTDPAKTLEKLAAYYSVGARSPITAQDIADLNPGVQVQLGAVFAIPAISYVVTPAAQPGAAPGDTFASIAHYYGLSVDAIAVCAVAVGGLFAAGRQLDIDTQLFDLQSTLGPGNASFRLERANLGDPPDLPPNPTPEQKAAYARAYMYSLYNSLSAGLVGNRFFEPSSMGLPFGPQDHDDGAEGEVFASHAQANRRRTSRLRAAAEQDFDYRQALGFGTFAQINPAPDSSTPGLPPKSENPYIGVGTVAQVSLRWQDIFGNTTITPFEQPPANYTGALNGSAANIRYQDRLIGIAGWPNVRASHIYQGDAGVPELHLNFILDSASYAGDKDQAKRDLESFTRIYFQLHQDYTHLGVPGVTGNAVSMRLRNGLLTDPDLLLSETRSQVIRDFVSDCVQFLALIVEDSDLLRLQPKATLSIPVALDQVVPDDIIALDVALTFERQALLVEPSVAALDDGLSVTSAILPQADSEGAVAYTTYATAFERAFKSSAWAMKIGEGLRQTESGDDQRAQQLWAVRFGNVKGSGIFFEIGTNPSYYAPRPVARSLESKTVTIIDYGSGRPVQSSFTGVDQNLWFQTCLDAIDTFLSDDFSSAAFILDKILGTNDPLKDGYLGRVLKAKQSLADSVSSTVRPILSTSATDPSTALAAQEKLRQQLLNQIGAAYAAGAVTVFGLTDVSGAPPKTPAGPPILYGQPTGEISGSAVNQNYTLSAARIPLGKTTVVDNGESTTYDPRLAFVFSSKNVTAQAYVPLDLALKISHLEFGRSSVPGIEGYVQSWWLAFVNGPFDYALGSGTANIPVVNRMLPTPPTVRTQSAGPHSPAPVTPSDMVKWDYRFEYLYESAAQDTVAVTIELNPQPDGGSRFAAAEPDLFTDLAQFISSYPDVLRDLNTYLTQIDAEAPSDETVKEAEKAVSAFATNVANVAASYAASIAPRSAVSAIEAPKRVEVSFVVALTGDKDGNAQTDLLDLQIDGKPATWDPTTRTMSNGTVTLSAAVVEIDPDQYQAQAINPPPENVSIAYRYKAGSAGSSESDQYLSYEDALCIPLRTVGLDALDVLAYQSAWSSISVQRNTLLAPVEEIASVRTTPDFLFQTPVVRFADPIVPRLEYASFPLDHSGDKGLDDALNGLFAGLFAGGTGKTMVEVSMASLYSYLLIPLAPRIQLPISMLTPTEAVVDPSTPPSFTAPFATSIEEWQVANNPTVEGDPQVNIRLQVFGVSGTKQPIVVVDDLRYPVIRQVPV